MSDDEAGPRQRRLAWALTGSGHDFTECLELIRRFGTMDLFLSKAAAEVIYLYTKDRQPFPESVRLIKDTSASAAPVGRFYNGWYHTLVVAPATSNTVAKCVAGISDTLVTGMSPPSCIGMSSERTSALRPRQRACYSERNRG